MRPCDIKRWTGKTNKYKQPYDKPRHGPTGSGGQPPVPAETDETLNRSADQTFQQMTPTWSPGRPPVHRPGAGRGPNGFSPSRAGWWLAASWGVLPEEDVGTGKEKNASSFYYVERVGLLGLFKVPAVN